MQQMLAGQGHLAARMPVRCVGKQPRISTIMIMILMITMLILTMMAIMDVQCSLTSTVMVQM